MGVVTDYFVNLISRQVDTAGIVVWYDPDAHYQEVAQNLAIQDTIVALYQGSFFALRHEIEPLLEKLEPPRLVVYVPLNQAETDHALIEIEVAGVVMRPGQQPATRNTRLSLIARNALKTILPEDRLGKIEKQVEAGSLSLSELDALAEKGEGITKGVLSLIFRAENPQDIALSFLTDEFHDQELVQKGALPELASLLQQSFEVDLPVGETTDGYRTRLARHILATDFIAGMLGEPPAALATVKTAIRSSAREACLVVARTWRLRRDLTESYAAYANRIEKEFGLGAMHFTWEQLASTETFQVLERKLQELVMRELLAKSTGTLVGLAVTRQSSFWAEYLPEVQAQWALIVAAGQLLLEADRIEQTLKTATHEAGAMFRAYTTGEHPWCLLDTCYRRMEHRYYDFGFHLQDQDEQLLSRARQRYMHVGSTLAETFLQAYKGQKFRMEGILRQLDIFKKKVMPVLAQGKVAYVWVDALRYEMGYELAQSMAAEAETHIEAALGTVPTITEIGMASLLPIDKEPVSVVAIGESKLALEIGGTCIKERKDRVTYLTSHAGPEVRVFEAKLDDLLPKPNKKVRDGISNADLVLITSQEIDVMGEEGNLSLARQTMDEMLRQLRKAFRMLGQLGVKTIIYTADHGHLFADELSDDMKIDAPGGDTRDLHRRVWIGHGGTADASYMRAKLADFGLGGGLEIAVPWNFACFKVKSGAEAYFHGGMSPQELFIPVVVLSPKRVETGMTGEISWNLMPGSQKISTRLYSVQIAGKASSLFELVPPKVRLEMHDGAQTVSLPISASYGFDEATSDVQLKIDEQDSQSLEPNTITLVITEPQPKATVSIHLIDVVSGVELARLDKVEMVIAI